MRAEKINVAVQEARRFLNRVELLAQRQAANGVADQQEIEGSRESAALRRASLDLSLALSSLRKRDGV